MARNGGRALAVAVFSGVALAAGLVAQQPAPPAPADAPVRNRLADTSSPYLLAHRDQPVHWQPWDEQALALARRLDKPIFVSIGYSACHWCHVMAKESFADPQVAARLNDLFVCIKVDREQRPDVDEVYMAALQAMGKQGGWPLSAWLTPDGKPFFAGTYFPPQDAHGLPGFGRILDALAKAWRERRSEVLAGADELTAHLRQELAPKPQPGEPDAALLAGADASAAARFDRAHGGFGAAPAFAPKFPNALELRLLLGGDDAAAAMARQTLRAMARGGIHDQLAGGFHRYTVDRAWIVPHFEKMLYDNALIAQACLLAWRRDGDAELRDVGLATLAWMAQELQLPAGGFAASLDAQSDGAEGRFYVWSDADFRAALGADADAAAGWFGVTKDGNFEGSNVLTLPAGSPTGAKAGAFDAAKAALRAARARRNRPAVDDKVIAAWNGLALRAFAEGFAATSDGVLLASARRNADFLLQQLVVDGRVLRVWRQGKAELAGGLDDHAAVADGLLALFEVDPEPRWLRGARAILTAAVPAFDAGDGGFWSTAKDGESLVVQARTVADGALPGGASLMAQALLRGGLLLADEALCARGAATVRAQHALLTASPASAPGLVEAARWLVRGPREVVVVGAPDDPATQALLAAARRQAGLVVVAHLHDGNHETLAALSPLFVGKERVAGKPAAYVCRRGVCAAPVTDATALATALAEAAR